MARAIIRVFVKHSWTARVQCFCPATMAMSAPSGPRLQTQTSHMSFRTERLAHAWPDPQADRLRMRGDDRISKRSEESILTFQAIDGRPAKECTQGFLTALASSAVAPYCLVALASGQTAKRRRSVRNDMSGVGSQRATQSPAPRARGQVEPLKH